MSEIPQAGSLSSRSPSVLSDAARAAFEAGTPAATKRAYNDDVRLFRAWCEETGRVAMPASADTLTEYATHLARQLRLSPSSIERARWAILKWHDFAGLPKPSTLGLVGVLRGYREGLATTGDPKAIPRKAAAASRDTLAAMLAKIDRATPAGCRDAAIILGGFSFGGRRAEIASLNISSIELRAEGMQVKVYRKKTRKMDDPVAKYREDPTLCPTRAVVAWIDVLATHGRTAGPLFVRIDQHGNIALPIIRGGVPIGDPSGRMTGQAVAQVIQRRARAAGLGGRWSGHSVRRGLATELHKAGATRRQIERQGGWSEDSRAVAGYIDDADRWLEDVLEGVL